MVIQIDVPDRLKPEKGDVLVFDGKHWSCASHNSAFANEIELVKAQNAKVAELKAEVAELKASVSFMANALKEILK